jgi:hypothetical protein
MDTPVTTPAALMVATEGLLLDHTPPGVASERTKVDPVHTLLPPVMGDGTAFTEIMVTVLQPPNV